MRCPKCKFSTFDYLDTCPRCGKDMTGEKTKLNISSIKPNPPFVLGSLTGDLSDSAFGIEALEQTKGEAENIEMNPEEIYDDGSELDITIDEKTVSEPDKDLELNIDDLGMTSDNNKLELDFAYDDKPPEMINEVGATEDVNQGADFQEGVEKESIQEEEPEEGMDELDLDSEDLEMKIDLEDVKNLDNEPSLGQNAAVESDEGDLELPVFKEDVEKESIQEEEKPENDMDELDLESEDLELNLELDDDEDTEK